MRGSGCGACSSCVNARPRARHNIRQIVNLGTYSRAVLQQLRARRPGLDTASAPRASCTSTPARKEFDAALAPAAQMRALGCERQVVSADEAVRLEPALRHIRPQLAGATYTAEDESGDANAFARGLAQRCEAGGRESS